MTRSALDTPMMRQFLAIKAQHPDAIVFYRMGDFYEMFLEDAERAAPLLEIALTTRDKGKPDAVPMCGIPVHSAADYIERLASLGHRVAICEQVEDPKEAGGRRLVRREVVEVVTPGLVGDPEGLDARREVSIAAVASGEDGRPRGLASLDVSTGRFRATDVSSEEGLALVCEELLRIAPHELLVEAGAVETFERALRPSLPNLAITTVPGERFEPGALAHAPEGLDPMRRSGGASAARAILRAVEELQPFALRQLHRLESSQLAATMILDASTRAHLELFESAEDRSRRGTLIECLDETVTPLGARELARELAYPLLDVAALRERQEAVAFLFERDRPRARLRDALRSVRDLERLLAKTARPGATPRDLAALGRSVDALPAVRAALEADDAALLPEREAPLSLPEPLSPVAELIREALIDDPPAIPKGSRGAHETGYIREGFRPELDVLRESARKGREWIAGLEAREREQTGISKLKARFHPVHGYSFEVSKTQLERVPEHWERKQTLASVERFSTPELREVEGKVLGAGERAAALEREIFESVRQSVLEHGDALQRAARAVAVLDVRASMAELARTRGWVRPEIEDSRGLTIRAGRHPVVEAALLRGGESFVPNDSDLDPDEVQILLLTGPNMSGKSTYLRQVALLVLLAQIGSWVPAEAARVGVVDRVFTRVGASDRLSRGESTFMVEMRETAEILTQATPRSLVILDEIGRGTSTFDGLSIAWAVAEYLHDTPGLSARTLFATHYHELADLTHTRPRVRNAHFQAREWGDEVVFLRRLVAGEANRSYGIQVARLAGLPAPLLQRAREVLETLEAGEAASGLAGGDGQLGLFAAPGPPAGASELVDSGATALAEALGELPLDETTPLEALQWIAAWKRRLAGEEET